MITAGDIEAVYPLSPMQQGMLFHVLDAPTSGLYHLHAAYELVGALDRSGFEAAWRRVLARHAALRSAIAWKRTPRMMQVVMRTAVLPIEWQDWRALTSAEQDAHLERFLEDDRTRGFDLAQAPLMRLLMARVDEHRHWCVWSHHHVMLDGWSCALVVKEVAAYYGAATRGEPLTLAPARPYGDYIAWLRQQDASAAEAFWRDALAGIDQPTPLPAAAAPRRDAASPGPRAERTAVLDRAASEQVRAALARQQLTLNTAMLGAWAVLLSRYSGSVSVLFGATVAGRPPTLADADSMIGLFINTLPVRLDVRPDVRAGNWLCDLQHRQIVAQSYAYAPLADIHQWASIPRGQPLFESFIVFESYPTDAFERAYGIHVGGTSTATLRVRHLRSQESASYPLLLAVGPGDTLSFRLAYDRERFDADAPARVLAQAVRLLEQLAVDPQRELGALSLLSAAERAQMVTEWNATAVDYGPAMCLHALVAMQAARTPDAIAVVAERAHLSYAALDARALQLAHHLRALGVGPEVRVGVCLERSLELVVTVLGIWHAGGAYVPLEPEHPPERLLFFLRDADAPVVVTTAALARAWMASACRAVVCVDRDAALMAALPPARPRAGVEPDHAAYVIYTSGSTGTPKGVVNTHRGVHNRLMWMNRYGLTARDRVLQKTPFGFDVSVWELLWPLIRGAALVLARPWGHRDAAYLASVIRAEGITTLHFVPSMLQAFVEADGLAACRSARQIFCSGEALGTELSQAVLARWDHALHNLYGPTEAAIEVTSWQCRRGDTGRVPIGRPIANMQVYVLDRSGDVVPIGVAGELHLGGVGVARGYVRRPALTAERFVPDPFGGRAGARLYRTGDRARWRADGALEYLGRLDRQVKVRGNRIELGEIEAVLAAHPDVQQAVAVAVDGASGVRLIAYVVARRPVAATVLRVHLQARLPEYMVPGAWVFLDALPLTASGKVDRRALPSPDEAATTGAYVSPRTTAEETLSEIWAAVLKRRRVGVTENFFELGGDSILSIQIVARAQQAGLQIQPRHLFQHQTIAALAAVAVPTSGVRGEQGIVEGAVPLTPIQRSFFDTAVEERHHFNQAVWLRTPATIDERALARVVRRLVAHHDALRMRYRNEDEGWTQWNAGLDGALDVWAIVDLTALGSQSQASVAAEACEHVQQSLDLTAGPLMRVVHLRLGAGAGNRLLAVAHHLVVDGVSWRILLEDLQQGYAAAARGERIAWPAKTSSYRQWAAALEAYAAAGPLPAEAAYWLRPAPPAVAAVPLEMAGGNTQASRQHVEEALSAAETQRLVREVAPAARCQIEEILLAAVWQSLNQWSGSASVLLELEGHGREEVSPEIDVTRTVGWFTTQFPVWLGEAAEATIWGRLRAVKERLRAIPHRGLGYGVWRYLSPDPEIRARLAQWPAAPISFNYLGQFDQVLEGDGWLAGAGEGGGSPQSARGLRPYIFVVVASIRGGQLAIEWQYSAELHTRATLSRLAHGCVQALREVLDASAAPARALSPVDFPHAQLPAADLERLWAEVGVAGRVTAEVEDVYVLSPMQAGMLFHTLEDAGASSYVQQMVYELADALEQPAFERAWQQVMQRHATLRTALAWRQTPHLVQVVWRRAPLPVAWEDLRGRTAEAQEQALTDYLERDRERGFDLHVAPLMRLLVARVAEHRYWCVWTHHHAIIDGWSLPLVLEEVAAHYAAARRGDSLVLPPERPYTDYIAWLQQQHAGEAETFWRIRLEGIEAATPLPGTRPASAARSAPDPMPIEDELQFSPQATETVRRWAAKRQLTLNTVIQGLWAVLLSRHGGVNDVLFGVTVAGRPPSLAGVERMVGLFINTIPVRARVVAAASLESWMQALQRAQLEAQPYECTSLVDIQRCSAVPPGQPLFESLVIIENYPVGIFEDQHGEPRDRETSTLRGRHVQSRVGANYPLTVTVGIRERLRVRLRHDPHRFERETPQRLLRQLARLFDSLAQHPEGIVGDLSLLSDDERAQIMTEWNASFVNDGPAICLQTQVAAHARRQPDATAAVAEGAHLSYAALEARALRLAQHLRARAVGPEVRVGLCLTRSLDFVVAVLGVWHAGGAYVPLDPGHPPERLAGLLADADVPVVVTTAGLAAAWMEPERRAVVCLDGDAAAIEVWPAIAPGPDATPEHAAYVIYTSGSTGHPKGVCVEHRQLSRYVEAVADRLHLQPGWHYGLVSTVTADLGHTMLFGSLYRGGTLHLVPEDVQLDAPALVTYCRRAQIDCLKIVPSHLRVLLPEIRRHGRLVERLLVLGGEAVSLALLRELQGVPAAASIANHYGPTECTVGATTHAVTGEDPPADPLPIGRPLRGVHVYVLDAAGDIVPAGVSGELVIGGASVARGYLHRAALTAARFVPDPFSGRAGARLYRTGDRARWRADGVVEFLGRLDHQVKVRGYRVELAEIETALAAHAGVQQAVVAADGVDDVRLIAYVVTRAPIAASVLQAHLAARLPEYMVPSTWLLLDALPLTANGKVDRRALPRPDSVPEPDVDVAPRTPVEEIIAGIFATVLRRPRVGITEDFFALGGHSLLAIQVVAQIQSALQADVPLPALFDAPTVAGLTAIVESAHGARRGQSELPVVPAARDGDLPLSFAQQRLWFLDRLNPGSAAYNVPVAVRLRGALDVDALRRTLLVIMDRHEVLRTTFPAVDGRPLQRIAARATLAWHVGDLTELDPDLREQVALAAARNEVGRGFDLAHGPLLRAHVFLLSADDHVLLVTMHHIISDGWSMALFMREFMTLYVGLRDGRAPTLPALPIQYADYAVWQRAWLSGAVLERHLLYWRAQLAALRPLELPTDYPRAGARGGRRLPIPFTMAPDTTAALKRLSQEEGVTVFMTMLAAFLVQLSRYAAETDVAIGTVVANRTHVATEPLIGFFVNTLVLRTDLSGDPTFRQLLARVRTMTLAAYAHQELPFERLVEELQPRRLEHGAPWVSVHFELQVDAPHQQGIPGLTAEPLALPALEAKRELTLAVYLNGGMTGTLTYDSGLYTNETALRMVEDFQRVATCAALHADMHILSLPVGREFDRLPADVSEPTFSF